MKDFEIAIPEPCRANWDDMTPKGEGRYCGSCSKIVVDFTTMTEVEIKNYFVHYKEQRICGHFYTAQVVATERQRRLHRYLNLAYEYAERALTIPVLKKVSLVLITFCMALTGCQQQHTQGEPLVEKDSSAQCSDTSRTIGKTKLTKPTAKCSPDSSTLTGDSISIEDPQMMLLGEVSPIKKDSIR